MRTTVATDLAEDSRRDDLLTTGEVASVMGVSRQHVVDLCTRGDLPFERVGTHRRIRRGDVSDFLQRSKRMGRSERRNLWVGYVTASKILADPAQARALATTNIERMRASSSGGARVWLDEWERSLRLSPLSLVQLLTEASPKGRELRQNSPFAGLLAPEEREEALEAWEKSEQAPND